ncbi:MAG: hypothetical protein VKK04_24530 [Synechococcales bacterium]|nr:hypothetical protein [Synechococcales bacterium]
MVQARGVKDKGKREEEEGREKREEGREKREGTVNSVYLVYSSLLILLSFNKYTV